MCKDWSVKNLDCFVCTLYLFCCLTYIEIWKSKKTKEGCSFLLLLFVVAFCCCLTYIEKPFSPLFPFYKSSPIFLKALNQFPNIMQRMNVIEEKENNTWNFLYSQKSKMYLWTLIADQMICTARNCLGPGLNANISPINIHADVWDVISCEKRGIVFFRFLVMFNQFHQPSFIQPSMVKIWNRI